METLTYLDTHVVAWLYAGEVELLPSRARRLIDRSIDLPDFSHYPPRAPIPSRKSPNERKSGRCPDDLAARDRCGSLRPTLLECCLDRIGAHLDARSLRPDHCQPSRRTGSHPADEGRNDLRQLLARSLGLTLPVAPADTIFHSPFILSSVNRSEKRCPVQLSISSRTVANERLSRLPDGRLNRGICRRTMTAARGCAARH